MGNGNCTTNCYQDKVDRSDSVEGGNMAKSGSIAKPAPKPINSSFNPNEFAKKGQQKMEVRINVKKYEEPVKKKTEEHDT
jgi:hypothetical protein